MNKTLKISIISLLSLCVILGTGAGVAQAKVTLGALAVTSDGTLTLTTGTTGAGDLTVVTGTGALVLTGSGAAVDALTLTDGDITVTSGDVTLDAGFISATEAANSAVLTLVNNTITTAAAMVDASSTTITTGALVKLDANTTEADGEVLEIISAGDATATPKGITVTIPDVTTGAAKGIDIVMAGATSGPIGLDITMAALTTSAAINVTANAATTTTGVVRVSATGQTDGNVLLLTGGGGTLASGGSVIRADMGAATAGSGLEIVTSADYVDLTDGLINVTANSATAGTLVVINALGVDDGTLLRLNATQGTLTSGKYIDCYDAAASDFTVAKYGATVIAGNASTDVLTVTAGDVQITAGDIDLDLGIITVDNTADEINHIKRNHATSTKEVLLIEQTHTGETGEVLMLDQKATGNAKTLVISSAGDHAIIDISGSAARDGDVIDIDMTNMLDERALLIDGAITGAVGEGVIEVHATGVIPATASLLRLDADTAQPGNDDGYILNIDDDTLVTGDADNYAVLIDSNANRALNITKGLATFSGGIDVNEDVDIDFDATDEEVIISTSAEVSGGGASVVTIESTVAAVGVQGYLLTLQHKDDGEANADFFVCKDNTAGDAQFSISQDGATVITGNASGTDALTLTKGDITVTDGKITVADDGGVISSVATLTGTFMPNIVQEDDGAGAGAISVATYYTAKTTGAGAEALTLANVTVIGQLKKIQLVVDGGGDGTLTFNTVNDTIVFADVGDYAILMWDGSNWIPVELGNVADNGASVPVFTDN